VSRKIPKDKYSALLYGLYWVYLEEKKLKIRFTEYDLNTYESCASAISF
jgi:hypothetical protein